MLRWVKQVLVFAVSVAVASGATAAEPRVIKIGAIQPMSGAYSAYAQEGEPAFEYVIKKINAAGGIKSMGGAKIEVILADDASQPSRSAAEARRLVSQEGVVLVVGSLLTNQMLAISPVLDEIKVPGLSLWAGGARSRWLYSIGFPYDRGYAKTMSDFIAWLNKEKGYGIKTAAMVYSNYEAGQQVNHFLTQHLKDQGIRVVGEVPLDVKASDQTAAVVRLRSLKPDIAAGLITPRDGQLLLKARFDLNYYDSLFTGGTSGFADMSLWRELGQAIGSKVLIRNLFPMTAFSAHANIPSVKAIIAELQGAKVLKTEIGQGAIQGAQAARIVQRALEIAGSTDPEKIRAALQQVTIPPGDPDLYLVKEGGIAFADDRMLKDGRAMIIQWTPDHRQDIVFPPRFATTQPRPFQRGP